MQYWLLDVHETRVFCEAVFRAYGFDAQESREIVDVILDADLKGIESHGIQRMVRYAHEVRSGMVDVRAKEEKVFETPLSMVVDAHDGMGQLVGRKAMGAAIQKAKEHGMGIVTVRNSNHYGVAGFYADMAIREDLIGLCMTNTEAIMVPTFGRQPMIGTNPIALGMPADPIPFLFDCATTVVPRGKFEVYTKRGDPVPLGWGVDENGEDSTDAPRILSNIIRKAGGGILPLGGSGEQNGGHKGYGLGMIVELFTSILSGGPTSEQVYMTGSGSGICQCFAAIDYGIFGDKAAIRRHLSEYLQRVRESDKARGQDRIYTHGEKEHDIRAVRLRDGIPANEKTIDELKKIAADIDGFDVAFPDACPMEGR